MVEEEEVETPVRRPPTLADVVEVVLAWGIGIGVALALGVAAARESFDTWRREGRL